MGKRIGGGFIALVIGAALGLLVALFVVPADGPALWIGGAIAAGFAALGARHPRPFLTLADVVLALVT